MNSLYYYVLCILAYADDIAVIGKNEIEIRKLFVEMENIARKFGLSINEEKIKYMIVERKNNLKKNKIGHLKIKNYKYERNCTQLGLNTKSPPTSFPFWRTTWFHY